MATENLTLSRNSTYDMTYTHVEAMTGGTLRFTLKPVLYDTDADDSDATIKKDVTSFSNGDLTASWTLTDANLYVTPGKNYHYDIVFEDSSGEATPPIFEGKVTITGHPTNRTV